MSPANSPCPLRLVRHPPVLSSFFSQNKHAVHIFNLPIPSAHSSYKMWSLSCAFCHRSLLASGNKDKKKGMILYHDSYWCAWRREAYTDGWWKRYRSLSCVYENLTYVSWVVRSNVITILLFWKCKVWWRTECCIECESPQYNWVLNVLVSLDRTRIGCFSLSRQSSGLAFSSHAQFFLFCPQEYHV